MPSFPRLPKVLEEKGLQKSSSVSLRDAHRCHTVAVFEPTIPKKSTR